MRIISRNRRRTEDAGSSGCPLDSVGCTTNPNVHDLTPVQASSLSQSLAASSASATSTAVSTDSSGDTVARSGVNAQVVVGVTLIAILILAFTMAIGYVVFGSRGERCCCATRRIKRGQAEGQAEASSSDFKGDSEAQLVQNT